jgi:hypothetical protein
MGQNSAAGCPRPGRPQLLTTMCPCLPQGKQCRRVTGGTASAKLSHTAPGPGRLGRNAGWRHGCRDSSRGHRRACPLDPWAPRGSPRDAKKRQKRPQKTALDAKRRIPYSRRLTGRSERRVRIGGTGSETKPRNDPRGWVCTGDPATAESLRTTKRITVGKEAGGTLRIHPVRSPGGRCRGTGVAVAERPIAPGNVSCPLPPWDIAFPGAFFCAQAARARRLGRPLLARQST